MKILCLIPTHTFKVTAECDVNLKRDALTLHMILWHIKCLEAFEKKKRKYSWLWLRSYYCAFFNAFRVGATDLYVYQTGGARLRTCEICAITDCNGGTLSSLLCTLQMIYL